jgi:hypothetical protein
LKTRQGKNQNYYVRAFFYHGNYDSKNQTQKFDLYLGVNYWATVLAAKDRPWQYYNIIHYSVTDTIYVCLVNTGFGVPFINGLDLRFMNDSPYRSMNGSLRPRVQADLGGHQTQNSIIIRWIVPLSFLTKSCATSCIRYDKNSRHRYRLKKLENLVSVFTVIFF